MSKKKKVSSKEIGLEIALILAKYFFHKDHLHYGYFPPDLEVKLANMPQAQDNLSDFIVSHIPKGVKTILDVGCGGGRFALKLTDLGYQVDGVSPSAALAEHARDLLGDASHIYECRYRDLQTEKRYDMILFSESFQYVNLEKAFENSLEFLNDGGYLLICDFFKTEATGENYFGGGHKLTRFYELISQTPFEVITDVDITPQTAPCIDIANDVLLNVGHPIWNLIFHYLNSNYPFVAKVLQWKYKHKIEKINKRYFSGSLNAVHFSKFKSYRLLLYKKS
jgi:SAM-dependent methyltransferase